MRALSLCLLAAACGSAKAPAPSRLPAEGDALVLQRVLDGTLAPADGLLEVAHSGGFPIATTQGYLFAIADGANEPYHLHSPSGSFADATLTSEAGIAWALVPVAAPAGATFVLLTRFGDEVAYPLGRYLSYVNGPETDLVARPAGARFERWPSVGDANIAARTLTVWIPAQAATHYLYAQDGQNLFAPVTAPMGGWRLQDAAGPTTLVVGIDNGDARSDEYTPVSDFVLGGTTGGRGGQYVDYLMHTVKPFIESHYGAAARNGIIGSSLGGLISVYAALKYPGAWDFTASLSGTLGWGSIGAGVHNKTVIEQFEALGACPAGTFYLDSGGGPGSGCVDSDGDGIEDDTGDAHDNYCETQQLYTVMESQLRCGSRVTRVWAQGASHNEPAWRARAPGALALFESL